MKISELAQQTGVSTSMLRYCEKDGLLGPARSVSNYRDYGETELETVRRIQAPSSVGIRLNGIRVLLPCLQGTLPTINPDPVGLATLQDELHRLDEKLHRLQENRQQVANYLERK